MIWIILFTVFILYCLIAVFVLSGENLSRFDKSIDETAANQFDSHPNDAESNQRFLKTLAQVRRDAIESRSFRGGLKAARKFADELSSDLVTDTVFSAVEANGVTCEWAVAPNAKPTNRIIFLHGGAFLMGSPRGHRRFCDQLSRLAKAAVLSVDYRMLPEHSRKASIIDSQKAYQWILENGPDGRQELNFLMVAGDSAGGNLAMMLSSWSKQHAKRRPDGVIGFSPSLDMTMQSPTNKTNRKTDKMLGEGLGLLLKIPSIIRPWLALLVMRINPASPVASPIYGDLSDLPPTLIHVSDSEMLLGESIRYTNKANEAGSNVTLQVWKEQLHDWHLFNMGTGSANVAWNEIAKFIASLQKKLSESKEFESSSDSQPDEPLEAANQ